MKGAPNFSADPVVTIDHRNIRWWRLCSKCGTWRGRNTRYGCFECFLIKLRKKQLRKPSW